MIFFTADHHFAHENVVHYCARPFRDADEMDAELIRRWNEVVGEDDTVYHLGDFTLSGRKAALGYFARLNGHKIVLRYEWHHDRKWLPKEGASFGGVEFLPPLVVLKMKGYPPITLCHYAMAKWEKSHRGGWHLFGHSHGRFQSEGKMLDIGVDAWDFAPISLERIAKRLA